MVMLRKAQSVAVQLLIGEIADLLGVTTKTIRYYEKIGLLDEPERTYSGYRLYNAQDLLRVYRIKQLQDLGLSLDRIRIFLREPEQIQSTEETLQTLEAEISAQITELEARRQQIRDLLAQAPVDILKQPREMPPTLQLLREQLGDQIDFDATKVSDSDQLRAQMDALLWRHTEYQEQQRELVQDLVAHPAARIQLTNLITRIGALTQADASELEPLADEIVRLRTENPILAKMMAYCEQADWPYAEVLGQILTGAEELAPPQRKLFEIVGRKIGQ
jgi:DNA-binding transcriptional MerR regulator